MKYVRILFLLFFNALLSVNPLNAQWVQLTELSSYSILSFVESDSDIFAGTDFQGVFRSTNDGNSWTRMNTGLTQFAIKVFSRNGADLYIGTINGVFKSTNNGAHWTSAGLTGKIIEGITTNGTDVFVGTNEGVFKSTDNGGSWNAINNGLTNTNIHALTVIGTTIFAGTWDNLEGIFISTDNGANWILSNSGLTNYYVSTFAAIGNNVFAGTNDEGVFRSTDNGASWSPVNNGLTNLTIGKLIVNDTNFFAGTFGGGIFLSTNKGVAWTQVNTGLPNNYIGSLSVKSSNLFAGTYGNGVLRRPLIDMPIGYQTSTAVGAGWNLVSEPLLPDTSNPQLLFPNNNGIYGYDTTQSYTVPTELTLGKGYWTYYTQPDTISFSGLAANVLSINISSPGWVLFGSRSITMPVSSLTSLPSGSLLGNIYRFNNSTQQFQSATEIVPGEGYWVYVTQPCQLKLP